MMCPYCGGDKIKPPKIKKWETPCFAHGLCLTCGKHPRAKVSWNKNEKMYISYSRDGRKPMPESERKSIVVAGRISPRELDDVEAGRKTIALDKTSRGNYTVVVTRTV